MKFRVKMKDPDTLYEAVEEAVAKSVKGLDLTAEERDEVAEVRAEKVRDACSKWFEYGEYLTVEIDTDQMTCEVVPKW